MPLPKGHMPNITYDVIVEVGDAVEKILIQVEEGGGDLVLISKHGRRKATHPLSLADAWIAACALMENGALVHKDPEFNLLS